MNQFKQKIILAQRACVEAEHLKHEIEDLAHFYMDKLHDENENDRALLSMYFNAELYARFTNEYMELLGKVLKQIQEKLKVLEDESNGKR